MLRYRGIIAPVSVWDHTVGMMSLIRSAIAPPTWGSYGKAWNEWVAMVGYRRGEASDEARLQVMVDYFLSLGSAGVSAAVAQRHLAGISFHFKLRGWPDVTKQRVGRRNTFS